MILTMPMMTIVNPSMLFCRTTAMMNRHRQPIHRPNHQYYYSSLLLIVNVPKYVETFLLQTYHPSTTRRQRRMNRSIDRCCSSRRRISSTSRCLDQQEGHPRIDGYRYHYHHHHPVTVTVTMRQHISRHYGPYRSHSSVQTVLFSTHDNSKIQQQQEDEMTENSLSPSSTFSDTLATRYTNLDNNDQNRSDSNRTTSSTHTTTSYQQFTELVKEILLHDELYYNAINRDSGKEQQQPQQQQLLLSDDEFDALVRLEEQLSQDHPDWVQQWYNESGGMTVRSQRVGAPVIAGIPNDSSIPIGSNNTTNVSATIRLKREHLSPMLSLDNALNQEQLFTWIRRVMKATVECDHEEQQDHHHHQRQDQQKGLLVEQQRSVDNIATTTDDHHGAMVTIITEPKLDGLSLSIRYEVEYDSTGNHDDKDGVGIFDNDDDDDNNSNSKPCVLKLQWASTRGDGKVGQDVTSAVLQMKGIPHTISILGDNDNTDDLVNVADDGKNGSSSELYRLLKQSNVRAIEVRGEVVLPRSYFLHLKSQAMDEEGQLGAVNATQWVSVSSSTTAETSDMDGPTNTNNTAIATTTPLTTTTIIPTFSNARNAASGILLRKEIVDDIEGQVELEELRSKLQFYAYDFAWSPSSSAATTTRTKQRTTTATTRKTNEEMDGKQIRSCLSDWGFQLSLPVEMTHVRIDDIHREEDDDDTVDDGGRNSSWWEEWIQHKETQSQLEPMLKFYTALEEHRKTTTIELENNIENDTNVESSTTGKKQSSPKGKTKKSTAGTERSSSSYEWGDFDMDGCVHKVSQAEIRTLMGYSMKSPKWAIAHKFPAEAAVSQLLDITIQVGRTGSLTPVAVLEPVEVGGVTIQRATLHNFRHLQDILGGGGAVLTRIPRNEPVLVRRAGDVIPQVVKRIGGNNNNNFVAHSENEGQLTNWISLEPPIKCPACGSPVVWEETKTVTASNRTDLVSQVVRCGGPPLLCPPRAITSLAHAFSRDALDVTGLSEARIQNLMDSGLLRYPYDIFQMDDDAWVVAAALPGWGNKSCNNLRGSIHRVATNGISLSRFIYSLGIRHAGKHTSELVASRFGSANAFIDAMEEASKYSSSHKEMSNETDVTDDVSKQLLFPTLQNQLGVGPALVDSLLAFSKSEDLMNAAKSLAKSILVKKEVVIGAPDRQTQHQADSSITGIQDTSRPWKGFRVVFTGTLLNFSRSEAEGLAKQLGAKSTPGSVSKSTDLLVYGDKGGKKLDEARGLGIATMTSEEFAELVKKTGLWNDKE
jgi:NAD-dependent DNA ligase